MKAKSSPTSPPTTTTAANSRPAGSSKRWAAQGDVILLRYNQGSESTEQREEGFLDTLKKEYPDVNILSDNQYAGTTPKSSQEKAMQILGQYKDQVDGMFAVCEPNAEGVLLALQELELTGKVKFVAFDPNADLVNGLESDKVQGIVLQDPVKMGYEAVMAMHKKLKGEEVKKRIVTGEHVATPENRKTEEMSRLLDPAQIRRDDFSRKITRHSSSSTPNTKVS